MTTIERLAVLMSDIGTLILVINVLLFIVRYKALATEIKYLGLFLLLCFVIEISSQWLFHLGINNLFLLHIYTLLELLSWSYFYYYLFRKRQTINKWLPYFTLILSMLIILNTIILEPMSGFNSNAKTLVQLTLIAYSVYYFFTAFGNIDLTLPVPRAITFINFSVILYYSGSLFIFMLPKLLTSIGFDHAKINSLWAINALLLLVFHTLISISLWTVAFRKQKS